MYEQLKTLDSITLNFNAAGINTINIVLAIIMFGVALGIKFHTFKSIFTQPKSIIVGLLLQWFGLPFVTFILTLVLSHWITPTVALGMILVAACPGGNISNFMSSYAKANVELSVSMTAVTTVFATLMTPFNFALYGKLYYDYLNLKASALPVLSISFLPMFKQVLLLLGIPIVLGILFSNYFPRLTDKIKKPFQWLSLVFFIFMVIAAFGQNIHLFLHYIQYIFIIVVIHNLCALILGYTGASIFRLPKIDRRSLTLEVGIQNSGLGLVLLFNPAIFPQEGIGGMLFITAWWGIWHIIAGLSVSSIFRTKSI